MLFKLVVPSEVNDILVLTIVILKHRLYQLTSTTFYIDPEDRKTLWKIHNDCLNDNKPIPRIKFGYYSGETSGTGGINVCYPIITAQTITLFANWTTSRIMPLEINNWVGSWTHRIGNQL